MKSLSRRRFLKQSLLGVTAISVAGQQPPAPRTGNTARQEPGLTISPPSEAPGIIDTNINLFDWPFRALKYRDTAALVAKLRKHRVIEAWAGSFEALLSKDMSGVNARLAAECRTHGPGFLIPFGSVNLAWPDWEEDVRRCHEVHKMPGLRIYPGYQPFDTGHPDMERLVKVTAECGMILQVVIGMEDPRVHHPIIDVKPGALAPLLEVVRNAPDAKLQLLHVAGNEQAEVLQQIMAGTNTVMDISRLEGNGAVGRLIGTVAGLPSARVPVERIVFGSHAPYFPLETAILKLIESPLDVPQLHAIVQGNARRLLPRG
jgi:predicted TIM-barrel fold metal-dependent hydrolase